MEDIGKQPATVVVSGRMAAHAHKRMKEGDNTQHACETYLSDNVFF
jgi:hypothetical protein